MDADWILIHKMNLGSDDAWDQFVRKYYGDILKYCYFHSRDRDSAEDLTQEVFLRFFSALPRYRHTGKAKNYLYTIASHLCADAWKAQRELSLEDCPECPADPISRAEDHIALMGAIRRLPEEFREVVVLHCCQGLKLSQTAAVLKIGLPLAKYRLKRGKELLRKELSDGT